MPQKVVECTKQAAVRASSELSRTSELPRHQLTSITSTNPPPSQPHFVLLSLLLLALEPRCYIELD